jgi:thiol-disulfide isomerase/thioredoxin
MAYSAKTFLFGAGAGIALVLALLEGWGGYLDQATAAAAQPHLLVPFKSPAPKVLQEGYQSLPRPRFDERLSAEASRWRLTPMTGGHVTFSQFQGQVVFLNLWSTTCVPCIEELPGIEKLQASLKDKRVVFLSVAAEPRSEVSTFLAKREIGIPVYVSDGKPPQELSAMGVPTTYIVSRSGQIVFMHAGALNWDDDRARAFLLDLAESASTAN